MPIRNRHWYNLNEGRAYPVDDTATSIDDAGVRMPSNVLVDLNLRWPLSLGRYAFVAGMTVTPAIVTIVFQAADTIDGLTGFQPLAAIAVPRTVTEGRQYALLPQTAGVGGWIVFGSGVTERIPYTGRFSSPGQSLLTARAARAYRQPPVLGARSLYGDKLMTGLVRLRAEQPLQVVAEEREIDGLLRVCAVLRLTEASGAEGVIRTAAGESTFKQFAGPCAGRPESNTCRDPQPIEFVNSVPPDCNGLLILEFQGCAAAASLDGHGIVLECSGSLEDVCRGQRLPDSEGALPGQVPPVVITPPAVSVGVSESVEVTGAIPYGDCFDDQAAEDFAVKSGSWSFVDEASPTQVCPGDSESVSESTPDHRQYSYASASASERNVTVWEGFDSGTVSRRVTTDVRLFAGTAGAKHNGGIVINYRPHTSDPTLNVYYLAEIDQDTQELRLLYFNGSSFSTVTSVIVPLMLNTWYRLTVDTAPGPGAAQVTLTVQLQTSESEDLYVQIGPIGVNNYPPATGFFGFHANRAITSFAFFNLEDTGA